MERRTLIQSKAYILTKFQIGLFNQINEYLVKNKINRTQFAEKLGVSKGYISQIMNGEFDHKISKLIELYLSIGQVPSITTTPIDEYLIANNVDKPAAKIIPLNRDGVELTIMPKAIILS